MSCTHSYCTTYRALSSKQEKLRVRLFLNILMAQRFNKLGWLLSLNHLPMRVDDAEGEPTVGVEDGMLRLALRTPAVLGCCNNYWLEVEQALERCLKTVRPTNACTKTQSHDWKTLLPNRRNEYKWNEYLIALQHLSADHPLDEIGFEVKEWEVVGGAVCDELGALLCMAHSLYLVAHARASYCNAENMGTVMDILSSNPKKEVTNLYRGVRRLINLPMVYCPQVMMLVYAWGSEKNSSRISEDLEVIGSHKSEIPQFRYELVQQNLLMWDHQFPPHPFLDMRPEFIEANFGVLSKNEKSMYVLLYWVQQRLSPTCRQNRSIVQKMTELGVFEPFINFIREGEKNKVEKFEVEKFVEALLSNVHVETNELWKFLRVFVEKPMEVPQHYKHMSNGMGWYYTPLKTTRTQKWALRDDATHAPLLLHTQVVNCSMYMCSRENKFRHGNAVAKIVYGHITGVPPPSKENTPRQTGSPSPMGGQTVVGSDASR